ncbi:ABC transporter substrate-binding protein [Aquabacter sp. L1I39]|uniref:ABC transporter substrate-binding protein n=1 Tax=Aquabacter sp. L1I39 TaxID=2820278 RepID=UPI001ADD1E50|nr:ABC transporter substrate-binding protein [Aquabacter sp. L1I39]QTL02206.1 ABC transporter substrate-binding protein [Aquabacter sp. L1I39]
MVRLTRRSFLAATAAAAVARPALVRAAQPLNVSLVLGNAIHWVQFVAVDKGMYKEEGFAPSLMAMQGSASSVQMALSGEYHLATSQPETFFAAVEQGASELAAQSAPMNKCDWVLVGARGVTSLDQIKGRQIGLSGLRNSESWLTSRLLAQKGLRTGDYSFVIAGTSPAKVAALEKGGIGAAVLFQPSAEFAVKQGLTPLAAFEDLRDYPTIFYICKKSWAAADGAGARAARAQEKAYAWLWNPANKAEAIGILSAYTKRDAAVLEPVYDDYFTKAKIYSRSGRINLAGAKSVLDDMAEDGQVFKSAPPVEKFLLDPKLGGLSGA